MTIRWASLSCIMHAVVMGCVCSYWIKKLLITYLLTYISETGYPIHFKFGSMGFRRDDGSNGVISGSNKSKMAACNFVIVWFFVFNTHICPKHSADGRRHLGKISNGHLRNRSSDPLHDRFLYLSHNIQLEWHWQLCWCTVKKLLTILIHPWGFRGRRNE